MTDMHADPERESTAGDTPATGIDPDALAVCLQVLSDGGELPADHPDSITLQRAVGRLFKEVKRQRRGAARRKRGCQEVCV